MFGVVHACRQTLGDELIEQWRAHLCGLCLSLRHSSGQLSRALTNTDAVMLSVLVEAQQTSPIQRSGAGPCPLRGMRTAKVVPADAVAARLGATASLTLAAGKAGDVLIEREYELAGSTLRTRAFGKLATPLRRAALADADMAESVQTAQILDDLARQGAVESETRFGDSVLTATAPTARATGRIFASSALLAGRPENRDALLDIGEAFGALAHLLDAVEDLETDRKTGAFNPITATGTPMDVVQHEATRLVRRIRLSYDRLAVTDGRLARALLVDGTHAALHRAFGSRARGTCATRPVVHLGNPGFPPEQPTAAPGEPSQQPPGEPDWPYPEDPPVLPASTEPPPKQPPRPNFFSSVLPWIGVYCTGFACCASHENPCTGRRHDPGFSNCGGCGDCCDCGDCCCDCDCHC